MEIHFQTTDHVVAVEKVAEHIGTKYSKSNNLTVVSHIIILGKSAITYSKVGQSSPNPKNIEERKNALGQVIYQKCVTVVVSEKTAWRTHPWVHVCTHMVQIIISRRHAGREIINCKIRIKIRKKYLCKFKFPSVSLDYEFFGNWHLSGTGLSLFAHQRLRGCLHQIRRYISVSYLLWSCFLDVVP